MLRRGEKLLLNAIVGGVMWRVVESDGKIEKDLKNQQGCCKPEKQTVYINRDETPTDGYEYVIAHELGHASIFTTGGKEGLAALSGLEISNPKLEALEEYIVGSLFHAQWDTLKRNGWLNIPFAQTGESESGDT